jgi:hypothetical protein
MIWSGILGKTAAGLGAAAGAGGVRGCGGGAGVSRSRCLRQRPLGVRIGMHQRARMGRLGAALERRVGQRLGKR